MSRLVLWLRYQRYAFVIAGACASAMVVALAAGLPWWGWVIVVPLVIRFGAFAVQIASAYPRKLRATRLATRRIERGSFDPVSLRAYCADPCHRVVASEVLRRAGYDAAGRRTLIQKLAAEQRQRDGELLVIDHTAGTAIRIGEGQPMHLRLGSG